MSEIVVPGQRAPVIPVENRATRPRVAWSAVFAGAFVVVAVELLLIVLGVGVGLGLVQPYGGGNGGGGHLGLAAGLWWLISTIIAFVFGCYVAARLAGVPTRYDGMLHGLVIWGLSVVVTFYVLAWAIGGAVGGALSIAGGVVSAAGQGLKAAVPELAATARQAAPTSAAGPSMAQQQAQELLQPANANPGAMSKQDAAKAIAAALPDLAAGGARAAQAKDRIVNIMAAQLDISRDEAAKRFDAAEARFATLRTEAVRAAKQAADESATAASRAGYAIFVVVLLDAIAACVGGALAVPRRRPVVVDDRLA